MSIFTPSCSGRLFRWPQKSCQTSWVSRRPPPNTCVPACARVSTRLGSPGRTEGLAVGLSATGSRRGGPRGRAGQPRGTTAHGLDLERKADDLGQFVAEDEGRVVRAAPGRGRRRPGACSGWPGRSRQPGRGGHRDGCRPPPPRGRGPRRLPPGRPGRPRRAGRGEAAFGVGLGPALQARRLRSPMAARRSGSRTTTKTQGCLFSALGAKVAACRTRSTRSSSSGSGRKARQARWRRTTSKKFGHQDHRSVSMGADRRRRKERAG